MISSSVWMTLESDAVLFTYCATVVRIAPNRVFFEWEEDQGGGKTRRVERVIELHAGEVQPTQ